MSLSLLLQQAQHECEQQPEELPNWVSPKNKSIEAWRTLLALEAQRKNHILKHRKPSDFTKSSLWQIRVSDVANSIEVKPATLDPTKGSKWAAGFRDALNNSNKKLLKAKEQQVNTYLNNKAKGNSGKTHDELLKKCQQLEKELENERRRNTESIWLNRISELSLPVKQILGLKG
ncbi:hypothetical protein HB763_03880 [Vibrio campbellii]|uniref:hypothetical protein n=1 Tax=Vibrio campbellii TaxID=680 RepID=UPI002109B0A7|nr:hypothetical protein [Vibrio campbellii]UTZ35916.1 hypothetical protein HB763_03880 [Vibrio campbellii]|tara:strand:+ start:1981 stop:2505 length:525 start_codon:yes stop_codon:yes gene_type:complete